MVGEQLHRDGVHNGREDAGVVRCAGDTQAFTTPPLELLACCLAVGSFVPINGAVRDLKQ